MEIDPEKAYRFDFIWIPHALLETQVFTSRFILPFLSSVTGGEVYVDRHLKMVETGGLGLAIAALASRDHR